MATDLEGRVARAVRALSDAVPVTPPDADQLIRRATAGGAAVDRPRGARFGGWFVPVLGAAAVLALLAGVALWPAILTSDRGPEPAENQARPVIPAEVAPLSLLTAPVTGSPPGPVALTFVYDGGGPRWLHSTQTVVVGADGRSYRRVDEAERRGGPAELGTWRNAPVSLSPDGTRLAVGSVTTVDTLSVVDLRTGAARRYPAAPAGVIEPLAWSPDGTRIAFTVRPVTRSGPPPNAGAAAILDLRSGSSTPLPVPASAAAFSPDGALVAVQGDADAQDPTQRAVRIVDRDGAVTALPATEFGVRLVGPAAWSPDGRLLAMVDNAGSGKRASTVSFLGTGPATSSVPGPIEAPTPDVTVVGWRAADRMLITESSATDDGRRLYEQPLTGAPREMALFERGFIVTGQTGAVQVATALLPDADIRPAGSPDRGPWPVWWRLTVTAAALGAAALGLLAWRLAGRRGPARPGAATSSAARPG
jgi:hypothetical protein